MVKRFIFDTNRCTGCHACMIACAVENHLPFDTGFRRVTTFNNRHHPLIRTSHLSIACNHCADPPCLKYCPADAYSKDIDTGAVTIDPDICIGCKYCTLTCPYDAPRFNPEKGITEKCTFCRDRLHSGEPPACVMLCPTDALGIEDWEPASDSSPPSPVPGFTPTDTVPGIRLVEWQPPDHYVKTTQPQQPETVTRLFDNHPLRQSAKTTIASEWPLIVFTSFTALQVSLITAFVLSDLLLYPGFMIGFGMINLVLASAHLGKKWKAHRAITHIRTSWLSREILLYGLFFFLSSLILVSPRAWPVVEMLTLATGTGLLVAVDGIYVSIFRKRPAWFGGADITISALIYTCLLNRLFMITLMLSTIRVICFYFQSKPVNTNLQPYRYPAAGIKIIMGLCLPVAVYLLSESPEKLWWMTISIFFSEGLQRLWFYLDLDIPTPDNQTARDFDRALDRLSSKQKHTTTTPV